jgi:hypothetical protein
MDKKTREQFTKLLDLTATAKDYIAEVEEGLANLLSEAERKPKKKVSTKSVQKDHSVRRQARELLKARIERLEEEDESGTMRFMDCWDGGRIKNLDYDHSGDHLYGFHPVWLAIHNAIEKLDGGRHVGQDYNARRPLSDQLSILRRALHNLR